MTLLAGFALLLSAHSGQDDLVIGSPVANRNDAVLEDLIGLFINTLPIRVDVSGNPTVEEFLNRVKTACVRDFNHQEIPFEKIVEVLNPPRSLNHAPLYQVAFDLQTPTEQANAFADLHIQPIAQDNTSAKFDLSLNIEDNGQELLAFWNFSEDLFVSERIVQFATRFASIPCANGCQSKVCDTRHFTSRYYRKKRSCSSTGCHKLCAITRNKYSDADRTASETHSRSYCDYVWTGVDRLW